MKQADFNLAPLSKPGWCEAMDCHEGRLSSHPIKLRGNNLMKGTVDFIDALGARRRAYVPIPGNGDVLDKDRNSILAIGRPVAVIDKPGNARKDQRGIQTCRQLARKRLGPDVEDRVAVPMPSLKPK